MNNPLVSHALRRANVALVSSLVSVFAVVGLASASVNFPVAQDNAVNLPYGDGWQTGDNGGSGMGAWTLSTTSANSSENGHFIGSSDLGASSWGLYANSAQTASATRTFNIPFTPGSVFQIEMDNGSVQTGGTVGFGLQNSSGENLLEVYFVGGDTNYTVNGNALVDSGVGFTNQGVRVVITLTTASTYQVTIRRLADSVQNTVSGSLANPSGGQVVAQLRLFNANAGAGSTYDLFFNNIEYAPGRVLNVDTGRGYRDIQLAINDPNTQNGHTIQLPADVYTGTITITKRITLTGVGVGQTILQANSPGIVITQSGATVSNLSLVGTGSDVGISTTLGLTNVSLLTNHISNFDAGVWLQGGSGHVVRSNVFTLTNAVPGGGVVLQGLMPSMPISNVQVKDNTFISSSFAVIGGWVSHSEISSNEMRQGIAGVRLFAANNTTVASNDIFSNTSYGVYLAPGAPPLVPNNFNNNFNVISGNVVLNAPDRGIQIINQSGPGVGNQIINNEVRGSDGEAIFLGAGSGDTGALVQGNLVENNALSTTFTGGIHIAGSSALAQQNTISGNQKSGLYLVNSVVTATGNIIRENAGPGLLIAGTNNVLSATLNQILSNTVGVTNTVGAATNLNVNRNAIVGNSALGVGNAGSGALNATCNWYGAASGPSGAGLGSGDAVGPNVAFSPWLLSDDLNGPCSSATLVVQKVVSGPVTPVTDWVFTATVPTGTLAFTLPASGGAITLTVDPGATVITEVTKLGYAATAACTTGDTGGSSVSLNLFGTVICTFTNTITLSETVITVTPVVTNGWAYVTETVGPGTYLVPFDIVLPPPAPTLGDASARMAITDVTWRHMYAAAIFTGTSLSDITVFEYRLYRPATNGQTPYINIGWDDDVTDAATGFRGRLVYSPGSLAPDMWHIVDARNDTTPRWYTTLTGATQCTSSTPCTFAQLVAAYPNAAIHPNDFLGVPLGFVGIRTGGGSSTGTGYADGLRVGVGNQVTRFDFEAAPPTTITLQADPTTTSVGSNALLTATVLIANGDPAADNTVVTFTTSLGGVTPVTGTTVSGVVTATLSSTVAGVATVTATAGSVSATAQVTFTPGAPFTVTLTATPNVIVANGISQSVVVATVTDQYGNPVPGQSVSFFAGIGNFSPSSGTTDANGSVTVTLTSLTPGAENIFAVSGSLSASTLVTYVNTPPASAPITPTLTTITNVTVVRKNDVITYQIVVTNTGTAQINNVTIAAPIPNGTSYVPGSASGGSFFGGMSLLSVGAVENAVVWSGSLAAGASHTLSYAVKVNILEGQITNQPVILVDNQDIGANLTSVVEVVAYKLYLPIVLRQ